MNPLPNEWAITHRADACASTHRPFVAGEYFYTLLYHSADGYRREDLSEEAWQNRNENIQPFSFWKSRYEPLPSKPAEPLPRENAEQLFRRLIGSENPPANACYVLAAMLERKRVLKQVKTEESTNGRVLIYEHGATGDVFIVPDPQLRLDELENVQNEVAGPAPDCGTWLKDRHASSLVFRTISSLPRAMAGVSDKIFRQLCKAYGADVLTTEFVSAEGIFRRNARTREYLDFDEIERPIGVQLFGADGKHMAEAACQVVDWVRPDFIDLNFGCPVKKVVSRNGGSALLKDCPTLASVATAVVRAIAPVPVTAKIRIGWDANSINATRVARLLVDAGIAAITVHGRTRAQGYAGAADWDIIGEVAAAVPIPVIGNGDLSSAADVAKRRRENGVAGAMIGRAAMSAPWIFNQIKEYLASGQMVDAPSLSEKVEPGSAPLPARGSRMGRGGTRYSIDARTPNGLFADDAQCETVA
jgi:tRNA-dihydrouridine synthase